MHSIGVTWTHKYDEFIVTRSKGYSFCKKPVVTAFINRLLEVLGRMESGALLMLTEKICTT